MVRFAETHRAIRPSSELFRFARAVGWTPEHYLPLTVPWPDGRETELNLRVLTSTQASDYSRYWFACRSVRVASAPSTRRHPTKASCAGGAKS